MQINQHMMSFNPLDEHLKLLHYKIILLRNSQTRSSSAIPVLFFHLHYKFLHLIWKEISLTVWQTSSCGVALSPKLVIDVCQLQNDSLINGLVNHVPVPV